MLARNLKKKGRACGSVTPAGFEGIATVGTLSATQSLRLDGTPARPIFRTANSAVAAPEPLLGSITSANALVRDGEMPADGWYLAAPFGEHPSPNGAYTQVFGMTEAQDILRSWNSMPAKAFRVVKNLKHTRKLKMSAPIFAAPPGQPHPDEDYANWSPLNELASFGELRTSNAGLEVYVTWNAAGMKTRERGPLHPSINWWHSPPDATGKVYPGHIESITLTRTPNIPTVPAWTANTLPGTSPETLAGTPQADNANQTANTQPMNPEQLNALRKSLGLPETADPAACIQAATTANAALATLAERDGALSTANSTLTTLNTERDTLRTQHGAIATERDGLRTAHATLTTERDTLRTANAAERKSFLDLAQKIGAITPAEREAFDTRISTANTREAAVAEIIGATDKPARKAMNTQSVEINGTRLDLSTANARQGALQSEVSKRMKANGTDYDTEFAAVKKDKNFSALFAAMQDPTKAAA